MFKSLLFILPSDVSFGFESLLFLDLDLVLLLGLTFTLLGFCCSGLLDLDLLPLPSLLLREADLVPRLALSSLDWDIRINFS